MNIRLDVWGRALGLAVAALVLLAACGGGGGSTAQEDHPGRQVYLNNCAACHGQRGEGAPNWQLQGPDGRYPPPPHDDTGHTWHHGDGLLFRIVKHGGASLNIPNFQSGMPAFQDRLSDPEIRDVLDYIKTFWGPEQREFQGSASAGDPFP